jgi:hypothetical protein
MQPSICTTTSLHLHPKKNLSNLSRRTRKKKRYLNNYSDDLLQDELDRIEAERRANKLREYDAWNDSNARTVEHSGLTYRRDHAENWCVREPNAEEEAEEAAARQHRVTLTMRWVTRMSSSMCMLPSGILETTFPTLPKKMKLT